MSLTTLLVLGLGIAIGFAAGAWWYRYELKRNPAKLDAMAAEVNAKAKELADRVQSGIDKLKKP